MARSGDITRNGGSDILALGFGTTVAMWALGYLCRLPPAPVPSWVVALGLLACLTLGGFLAGRYTARGWLAGAWTGLLASALNLLVLGSLLGGSSPNRLVPSALWWLPGSLLVGSGLGAVGGWWGARRHARAGARNRWTGTFAGVAAVATLLLLVVGGLVTSEGAGLAVVDWPNSFGYNMFLYPLGRMTGGIYFEHAHRLFGSLVGLTTLVLAAQLQRVEARRWVKRLGWLAVVAVAAQGVLGGLRVTGHFTLAASPEMVAPDIRLAVVHGVLGQAFFALMVAIAAFTSTTWTGPQAPAPSAGALVLRALAGALVAALFVQLVLGAVQRHLVAGLYVHITLAALVLGLALVAGVRAAGGRPGEPVLPGLGRWLIGLASVQVCLGVGALVAKGASAPGATPAAWAVLVRTAHQATGAALLGCAVLLALWVRRLLVQAR